MMSVRTTPKVIVSASSGSRLGLPPCKALTCCAAKSIAWVNTWSAGTPVATQIALTAAVWTVPFDEHGSFADGKFSPAGAYRPAILGALTAKLYEVLNLTMSFNS